MNKYFLITIISCLLLPAIGQVKIINIEDQEQLFGHVKSATTYYFKTTDGQNVDTSNYWQKIVTDFDEKGNEKREIFYEQNGELSYKSVFEYLGDSIVIQHLYHAENTLSEIDTFKFNIKGYKTEVDEKVLGYKNLL